MDAWSITISSPADGPYVLLDRLTIGNPNHALVVTGSPRKRMLLHESPTVRNPLQLLRRATGRTRRPSARLAVELEEAMVELEELEKGVERAERHLISRPRPKNFPEGFDPNRPLLEGHPRGRT